MKKLMLTIVSVAFLVGGVFSQKSFNIPLIGSKAPSFTAKSTNGEIKFPDDFGKDWKILFSHPQDFTPVCSSELLELAYMQKDFDRLGVQIAIISRDDVETHNTWKMHLEELDYKGRGTQQINFPILDDSNATASRIYGMLHEPTSTTRDIRGVFIIDSENVVRSINFYPMQVGRNMNEIVRIVEALQTTDESQVLTPANWNEGDDVMIPYFPYTKAQLEANPELKDKFYNMGNRMWF
ncbi:MAG: redoxin domain-containing protein, partial [Draconibacterium sp.]|nr:redoxin domain-containing protein [Draconibacterium sp.]